MTLVAVTFWDYLWGFLTVMIGLSLLVLWIYLFIDIMTRRGLSPVARVLWVVVLFVLPWIGGLIYLLVRPFDGEFSTYFPVKKTDGPIESSWTREMTQIVALHESGRLTDGEFQTAKTKLLAEG